MNIKQLEVLRTLLSTGSTIATAKAMGLSQSGISRLLAQLEADLSLTLFARDKGGSFRRRRLHFLPVMRKMCCWQLIVCPATPKICAMVRRVPKSSASACRAACGKISRQPC